MSVERVDAIIMDLDGTLCNSLERVKFLKRDDGGKPDWNSFYENAANDEPNEWCLQLVYGMQAQKIKIIYITGRPEKYRKLTTDWLSDVADLHADEENLFMRKDGDYRQDSGVKAEIFDNEIVEKYNVLFAVDDRPNVVDMWRSKGLICLTHCDVDHDRD